MLNRYGPVILYVQALDFSPVKKKKSRWLPNHHHWLLTMAPGLVSSKSVESVEQGENLKINRSSNYQGQFLDLNSTPWWFKVTFLGWLSDPFKGISDLQLGDEKGTLNHLDIIFWGGWFFISLGIQSYSQLVIGVSNTILKRWLDPQGLRWLYGSLVGIISKIQTMVSGNDDETHLVGTWSPFI